MCTSPPVNLVGSFVCHNVYVPPCEFSVFVRLGCWDLWMLGSRDFGTLGLWDFWILVSGCGCDRKVKNVFVPPPFMLVGAGVTYR